MLTILYEYGGRHQKSCTCAKSLGILGKYLEYSEYPHYPYFLHNNDVSAIYTGCIYTELIYTGYIRAVATLQSCIKGVFIELRR